MRAKRCSESRSDLVVVVVVVFDLSGAERLVLPADPQLTATGNSQVAHPPEPHPEAIPGTQELSLALRCAEP